MTRNDWVTVPLGAMIADDKGPICSLQYLGTAAWNTNASMFDWFEFENVAMAWDVPTVSVLDNLNWILSPFFSYAITSAGPLGC